MAKLGYLPRKAPDFLEKEGIFLFSVGTGELRPWNCQAMEIYTVLTGRQQIKRPHCYNDPKAMLITSPLNRGFTPRFWAVVFGLRGLKGPIVA
jgi:hypothetical protein